MLGLLTDHTCFLIKVNVVTLSFFWEYSLKGMFCKVFFSHFVFLLSVNT